MTVPDLFPCARITSGPQEWQVLQRGADGRADVALEGGYGGEDVAAVEVRVAREDDGAPAAGCDWQGAEMLPESRWRAVLRPPTGGLYRIETRIRTTGKEWRSAGERIWHVSVGDLWVIAGQSNAVGYGHGTVLDPPSTGVSLFGVNERWRMAAHPVFDPTGTLHPASLDSGWVNVSPWLAFGKCIREEAGIPVGLIPAALGGSPLCSWDPGAENPFLLRNLEALIAAAGGRIAGMAWYQGCSDTDTLENASTYLARFTRFVEGVRARYGTDLPVLTVQLNRHLDAAPDCGEYWSLVREAQRRAAKTLPRLAVLPALDLSLSDAIHNSAAANVLLGQRCGQAALGMVYGKELPWRPADAVDARFTTPERDRIAVRFEPVADHLVFIAASPADFAVEDDRGAVPVKSMRVEEPATVVLELERAAAGGTRCHNMPGANPPCTLRDHQQRPVLAFHGLPVGG